MIQDLFDFFNEMLGFGSTALWFGSATANGVANTVLGSIGLPNVYPDVPWGPLA